ncbi:aldehyde dehydrogenase family protein [Streptomyces lanatus]|uniref:Aldehyde dehydrogenase family protein n=1 Tax=Streptomyces lanatus TaxID=66900 RepID=A0ABV1Y5Z0_9ACTN|nr:aldehyde dehydrogenase family protein [Streptomyces lanatus]GHH30343.1 aldehyde dehydrogenase [Streptomyces lanatus]
MTGTELEMTPAEVANRARLATLLGRDWRLLVGGELIPAAGGATFPVTSPIDGAHLADIPNADQGLVDQTVQLAETAFPQWRDTDVQERGRLVGMLADLIEEHIDDLALLDAVDGGAPISVMAGDVRQAAKICRYFAGLALELKGETIPASRTGVHFTLRQPFGVVAKIIPFNHPILFAVSKLAAPLVAGNTVVLKPAEATPLSALYFGELAQKAFPPGVLQIVVGDGPAVPRALVRHPSIRRIGFTGSETTGRGILRDAAEVGVKDITLELGGKNALIAFPDTDPAQVAAGAVRGMNFTWSGQSCGSTSRLIVHESIADAVLTAMVKQLAEHTVGSPLDPAHHQGPVVNRTQYDKVVGFIDEARRMGAQLVTGGGRPANVSDDGFYLAPTILDRVDAGWPVATDEIFGPVLSVIRWGNDDDPVAIANSVQYGLTGSVYTNDLRRAHRVANALETGYVWVNGTAQHFLGTPFGGVKSSGLGREESIGELLSYTQEKAVHVII